MTTPFPFEPAMGLTDLSVFEAVLETIKPRFVLEWGSGGGTKFVLDNFKCIERYISIEHDDNWFKIVKENIKDPRLELNLVPLDGAHTHFEATRFPPKMFQKKKHKKMFDEFRQITETEPKHTKTYVEKPKEFNLTFDFILVDGRGRNFCLPVAWELVRSGGAIILHDAQRPEYHKTLKDYSHRMIRGWDRGQICLIHKP
jgi:hypothetical protein